MTELFSFPLIDSGIHVLDSNGEVVFDKVNGASIPYKDLIRAINGEDVFRILSVPEFYVENLSIRYRTKDGRSGRLFQSRGLYYISRVFPSLEIKELQDIQTKFAKECCEKLNQHFRYNRIYGKPRPDGAVF